ncbi:MAG: hypothetical protein QM734_14870 [Cyclobacteriaceae bacterium]
MDFNWRSPMFTRLAIFAATVLALGITIADKFSFIVTIALLAAIAFQGVQLLKLIERPQAEPMPSLDKIKFDEVTQTFRDLK